MIALHRAASHQDFVNALACFADWTIKYPGKIVAHDSNTFGAQTSTASVSARQVGKAQTYSALGITTENYSRPAFQTSSRPSSSCLLYVHLAARNMAIELLVPPVRSFIDHKASIRVTFPTLSLCHMCCRPRGRLAAILAATLVFSPKASENWRNRESAEEMCAKHQQ